jgi:flagellar P-ring protein precursor FlgI
MPSAVPVFWRACCSASCPSRVRRWSAFWLLVGLLGASLPAPAASRLKDVANLEGVRDNQLIGYGVVVGLAGTGDRRQTVFSVQTLTNMLARMGVSVDPTAIRVMNTAAVMVTATLPPFARTGSRIDVTVSAIGDAGNLQGGVLLLTPLRGVDGQTYAVAQGPVTTGGFLASSMGSTKSLNHPTVGRTTDGAIIERNAPAPQVGPTLRWQLRQPDFTTACRVAEAIDKRFGNGVNIAVAENSGSVRVSVPSSFANREVQFIADMEHLTLEVERKARIVLNERTGTVVMGNEVTIRPASILHGALTVEIQTQYIVSQPLPFSQGSTQVAPDVKVNAGEEKAKSINLPNGATVEALVKSLTSIGATVRDVIAILQALKAGGALDAEIEVI